MTFDLSFRLPNHLVSVTWADRPLGSLNYTGEKMPAMLVAARRIARKTVRMRGRNLLPQHRVGGSKWQNQAGELKDLVRTDRLSFGSLVLRYTRRYPMTMEEVGQWADRGNLNRVRSLSHTA